MDEVVFDRARGGAGGRVASPVSPRLESRRGDDPVRLRAGSLRRFDGHPVRLLAGRRGVTTALDGLGLSLGADGGLGRDCAGSVLVALPPPVLLQDRLRAAGRVLLVVALLEVLLEVLPPLGEPVEEAERLLGGLVKGHLVLVLAALLGEGTGAVVNPLVTVDLGSPLLSGRSGNNAINTILGVHGQLGWPRNHTV